MKNYLVTRMQVVAVNKKMCNENPIQGMHRNKGW